MPGRGCTIEEAGMEEKKVAVRGGMFQTEVIEDGDGPPLLFLHGVQNVQPGDPLIARLARTHRVIAPRLPGFGESSGTEHLLDLHDLLYYELDLLDTLGLRNLPVAGHSLGAMIAAGGAAAGAFQQPHADRAVRPLER
jgi:pimeloyl-ACP methyl ester carboxylesterase